MEIALAVALALFILIYFRTKYNKALCERGIAADQAARSAFQRSLREDGLASLSTSELSCLSALTPTLAMRREIACPRIDLERLFRAFGREYTPPLFRKPTPVFIDLLIVDEDFVPLLAICTPTFDSPEKQLQIRLLASYGVPLLTLDQLDANLILDALAPLHLRSTQS